MNKEARIRRMFPGANTPKGFYSLFSYIMDEDYIKRYIIKGGPGTGKSTLMNKIASHMFNKGYDIDEYHCPTDPESLDAIYIPKLKVALIDGTSPHVIEPSIPGVKDDMIWLGKYWDQSVLMERDKEILCLNWKASRLFKTAFSYLSEAKLAYNEWKSYILEDFDREAFYKAFWELEDDFFSGDIDKITGGERHIRAFASAISGLGLYSFSHGLVTKDYKVYGLKGDPGSGVFRGIEMLARKARDLGFYTHEFYSPVDIKEIDLLLVPQMKKAVINLKQIPINVTRLGDNSESFDYGKMEYCLDFDSLLKNKTLTEFSQEIGDAKKRFYSLIHKTVEIIKRAKEAHGELEKIYARAMNFEMIDEIGEEILSEILRLAEKLAKEDI